jgi:hypothetical protein
VEFIDILCLIKELWPFKMFFRGANSIEGRGTWFFRKNFLFPIRTKLR